MANRDIVVVGGSAGALEALKTVLPGLPGDFPAAIFVVIHIGATTHSVLPEILSRAGPLPAQAARDGARFKPGCIYVAPPDRHLLLDRGRIALRRGPRENLARPAIDPLFRSAAAEFGPRVIGVLLSGMLYDGASGLRAIKRCGAIAVVQADASYPEMPSHALDVTEVDHRVPAGELAALLVRLAAEPAGPSPEVPEDIRFEARMAAGEVNGITAEERLGALTPLTCPECGGSLWEIEDGAILRHRCHAGHAYDGNLLLAEQSELIDRALWSALRVHEERSALLHRHAEYARARDADREANRWDQLAAEHDEHVHAIRQFLMGEAARLRRSPGLPEQAPGRPPA
jgi:two-component system, chemotaxis family, protein-glutamate methylesterase/glutaminase